MLNIVKALRSEDEDEGQSEGPVNADDVMRIKDVNVWYGDNHAIKDVTMDIQPRKVTAFIGPSGCGKSTLLRTLNRRWPTKCRNYAMVLTMLRTGLRVGEAVALRWERIDFRTRRLLVREGKGSRDRVLFFDEDVREAITEWRGRAPDSPFVFSTLKGGPLTTTYCRQFVKRAARKAGIAEWERVERSQLDELLDLHARMRRWDQSFLDVTNPRGLVVFALLAGGGAFLAYRIGGLPRILAVDAMVLLLPHWITGVRSILTRPKLMVRVKLIDRLLEHLDQEPGRHRVHLLMLLRGREHKIPNDVKLKVDIRDHPPDFLGLYGQVVINEVNGTSYPYFYVVLVARSGFGLEALEESYERPANRLLELDQQDEVEVLVLRQRTTRKSGYHTPWVTARRILDEGVRLAEQACAQRDAA